MKQDARNKSTETSSKVQSFFQPRNISRIRWWKKPTSSYKQDRFNLINWKRRRRFSPSYTWGEEHNFGLFQILSVQNVLDTICSSRSEFLKFLIQTCWWTKWYFGPNSVKLDVFWRKYKPKNLITIISSFYKQLLQLFRVRTWPTKLIDMSFF